MNRLNANNEAFTARYFTAAIEILKKGIEGNPRPNNVALLQELVEMTEKTRAEVNKLHAKAQRDAKDLARRGGAARARSLSPRRKKAIARKAAQARWSK